MSRIHHGRQRDGCGYYGELQHLFARTDLRKKSGVESIPSTYEELFSAAEKLRSEGVMDHSLVVNMNIGWNVGGGELC